MTVGKKTKNNTNKQKDAQKIYGIREVFLGESVKIVDTFEFFFLKKFRLDWFCSF